MTTVSLNNIVLNQIYSDKKDGSLYRNTASGASTPREITVKHSVVTDKANAVSIRRSVIRYDKYVALTNGKIMPVSCYVVASLPLDANVTTDVIRDVAKVTLLAHGDDIAQHDGFSRIGDSVFVNAEQ